MPYFDDFIKKSKGLLEMPLPGEIAHNRMEPVTRQDFPIAIPDLSKVRKGGVMIVMFPQDNRIFFPLIQRSVYNGVHSGQVSFPGGKYEDNDGSILNTALRETEEETGICCSEIKVIGKLSQIYIPPSNFLVQPFVGYLENKPLFTPDPDEVSELITVSIDELTDASVVQEKEISVRNIIVKVPCYFVRKKVVWGATSKILSEFVEIIS